jgi:hypothetical protein
LNRSSLKRKVLNFDTCAKVAELVDALDLGSSGISREGSNPSFRTKKQKGSYLKVKENFPFTK